MCDTKQEDWLLAMETVHPVRLEAELTWDKVESILVRADKYNMPALMQRLHKFLLQNIRHQPCCNQLVCVEMGWYQ